MIFIGLIFYIGTFQSCEKSPFTKVDHGLEFSIESAAQAIVQEGAYIVEVKLKNTTDTTMEIWEPSVWTRSMKITLRNKNNKEEVGQNVSWRSSGSSNFFLAPNQDTTFAVDVMRWYSYLVEPGTHSLILEYSTGKGEYLISNELIFEIKPLDDLEL